MWECWKICRSIQHKATKPITRHFYMTICMLQVTAVNSDQNFGYWPSKICMRPSTKHRNTSSCKHWKPMVTLKFYSPGGIFLPQDRFLSPFTFINLSLPPFAPPCALNPSLSLLPSHLFCFLSIYLSLSFTTIYLSFLSWIYLSSSSASLSFWVY